MYNKTNFIFTNTYNSVRKKYCKLSTHSLNVQYGLRQ